MSRVIRVLAITVFAACVATVRAADPNPGRHLVCYGYSVSGVDAEIALYSDARSGTAYAKTYFGGTVKTEVMATLTPPSLATTAWEQGVGIAAWLQSKVMFPFPQAVVSATWERHGRRLDKISFRAADGTTVVFDSAACARTGVWNNCPLPTNELQHCWADETCCGPAGESRCCPTSVGCNGNAAECYSAAAAPVETPASVSDAPATATATPAPVSVAPVTTAEATPATTAEATPATTAQATAAPVTDTPVTTAEATPASVSDAPASTAGVNGTESATGNATNVTLPPSTSSGININVNISAQYPDGLSAEVSAASTLTVRVAMALAVIVFATVAFA